MKLRELVNQITDNDFKSSILDYELQPCYSNGDGNREETPILGWEIDHTIRKVYLETQE